MDSRPWSASRLTQILDGDTRPARSAIAPSAAPSAALVARRLGLHTPAAATREAALAQLLGQPVAFPTRALIAQAGDKANLVTVIAEGFACRMSLLADGRRQIHSVFLPGDTADAEAPLLAVRPDNIEALTACSAWLVPQARLASLLDAEPALVQGFAREAAIAAQVAREWVVNIGQRDASERIAHLLCELHLRMTAVGLAQGSGVTLPLTQMDLADAAGLSPVHVNRVLQDLRAKGLVRTHRGRLEIVDLPRLRALGLFDPLYLQLGAVLDSPM